MSRQQLDDASSLANKPRELNVLRCVYSRSSRKRCLRVYRDPRLRFSDLSAVIYSPRYDEIAREMSAFLPNARQNNENILVTYLKNKKETTNVTIAVLKEFQLKN